MLAFSCSKKEDIEVNSLKGVFSSKNIFHIYDPELYTREGKVLTKNAAVDFVKNKGLTDKFIIDGRKEIQVNIPFIIEMDGNGNFSATSFGEHYVDGEIQRKAYNIALLVGKESTYLYTPGITEIMNRFPPPVICKDIPSSTGYPQICTAKIVVPIEVKNSKTLVVPVCSYYYSWDKMSSKGYLQGERANFLKSDFYKELSIGDTVLIQRKEHVLEKI